MVFVIQPRAIASAVLAWATVILMPSHSAAHCDGLDGPVVQAAKKALEKEDVNLVLVWVRSSDEAEVRKAFAKALTVRKLGADALEVADRFFFETVVRLHRAGEGVAFTGLKPAGRDLGPAIPAADKAIAAGSLKDVDHLLTHTVRHGLEERFNAVIRLKDHRPNDVAAGRKYVEAYVSFIHYVEGVYEAAARASHGHAPDHVAGKNGEHVEPKK